MAKILKLIVLIAVVALVWKKGLPWIQSYGFTVPGTGAELNTEGWGCVRQAEEVRDLMAEILSRARPNEPVQFLGKLQEEQHEGEVLCRCQKPGCAEGSEALALTSELTHLLGDPARVGEASLQGPRKLEMLESILERAQSAARSAVK